MEKIIMKAINGSTLTFTVGDTITGSTSIKIGDYNNTAGNLLSPLSTDLAVYTHGKADTYNGKASSLNDNTTTMIPMPEFCIEDITILQPNKVMRVRVGRYGTCYRDIICVTTEPDEFDMERGCYIALAKYKYGKVYTIEGIEAKATEFSYTKECIKVVRQAVKAYQKKIKLEEEDKKKELEDKQRMAVKKAKKEAKKKARRERQKMDLAEAILLAHQIMEIDKKKPQLPKKKSKVSMTKIEEALKATPPVEEEESVHTE